MISNNDITIRLAKYEDRNEICPLVKSLGLHVPETSIEIDKLWCKLWIDNPYYIYFDEQINFGWVLTYQNRIVGFFGSIPRLYYLNNNIVPASIAGLWGVQKEFRGFTHLLCDSFFNSNPIDLKIVTTAIKPTGKIFEKYRGQKIPLPKMINVQTLPLDIHKLFVFNFADSPSILRLSIFFKLANLVYRIPLKLIKRNNHIREVSIHELPSDLNSFFEKDRNKSNSLISLRNKDVIKWYYERGSKKLDCRIFIYKKDNDTLGFVSIVMESIDENSSIVRYKIIDIAAESNEIKKLLIKELIRIAYKEKAHLIEIHLGGRISSSEIPWLTFKRKYNHFPLFFQCKNSELNQILQNKDSWNIMSFDGDTCLG